MCTGSRWKADPNSGCCSESRTHTDSLDGRRRHRRRLTSYGQFGSEAKLKWSGVRSMPYRERRTPDMWAQLITMRLKPGREGDLPKVLEGLRAAEQPDPANSISMAPPARPA